MLQSIRERAQGVVAWIIVIMISATFALWGVHNYLGAGNAPQFIAKVDGQEISKTELNRITDLFLQEERKKNPNLVVTPEVEGKIKKEALDALVTQAVVFQEGSDLGLRFDIPNLDPESYLKIIFLISNFNLPNEKMRDAALAAEQRTARSWTFLPKDYLSKVNVTDEAIQTYYNEHHALFTTPDQVSIQYILLSMPSIAKTVKITDSDVQSYYEEHTAEFQIPARYNLSQILIRTTAAPQSPEWIAAQKKINDLFVQAKKNSDFESLAKANSQDLFTAKQGGKMGWVVANQGVGQDFAQALNQPNLKAGDILAPIQTRYGFVLIKVWDVEPSIAVPLANVKNKIVDLLQNEQIRKKFAEASDQLTDLTYSNSTTLNVAAQKLNLEIKTSDLFNRAGGTDLITKNAAVLAAAFSDDVLTQGYNSSVIQLDDNTVLVLRVQKHIAPKLLSMANVRDQILKTLKQEQAVLLAEQVSEAAYQQLIAGKMLPLPNESGITAVDRENKTLGTPLIRSLFNLSLKKQPFGLTQNAEGHPVILQLLDIKTSLSPKNEAQIAAATTLTPRFALAECDAFVQGLRSKVKIEYPENK